MPIEEELPGVQVFFKGASYLLRRDGSGRIEWSNLGQLARVEIDKVLQYAQETQRDQQHAVSLFIRPE